MKKFLIFAVFTLLVSCSKDSEPSIDETNITMKINGVEKSFLLDGYGIDLQANGTHKLTLWMVADPNTNTVDYDYVVLEMTYKKKGTDVFTSFTCYANPNGEYANAVGSLLHNKVTINNRKQFAATVSGTMTDGINSVEITDGVIEVVYDDPFDQ